MRANESPSTALGPVKILIDKWDYTLDEDGRLAICKQFPTSIVDIEKSETKVIRGRYFTVTVTPSKYLKLLQDLEGELIAYKQSWLVPAESRISRVNALLADIDKTRRQKQQPPNQQGADGGASSSIVGIITTEYVALIQQDNKNHGLSGRGCLSYNRLEDLLGKYIELLTDAQLTGGTKPAITYKAYLKKNSRGHLVVSWDKASIERQLSGEWKISFNNVFGRFSSKMLNIDLPDIEYNESWPVEQSKKRFRNNLLAINKEKDTLIKCIKILTNSGYFVDAQDGSDVVANALCDYNDITSSDSNQSKQYLDSVLVQHNPLTDACRLVTSRASRQFVGKPGEEDKQQYHEDIRDPYADKFLDSLKLKAHVRNKAFFFFREFISLVSQLQIVEGLISTWVKKEDDIFHDLVGCGISNCLGAINQVNINLDESKIALLDLATEKQVFYLADNQGSEEQCTIVHPLSSEGYKQLKKARTMEVLQAIKNRPLANLSLNENKEDNCCDKKLLMCLFSEDSAISSVAKSQIKQSAPLMTALSGKLQHGMQAVDYDTVVDILQRFFGHPGAGFSTDKGDPILCFKEIAYSEVSLIKPKQLMTLLASNGTIGQALIDSMPGNEAITKTLALALVQYVVSPQLLAEDHARYEQVFQLDGVLSKVLACNTCRRFLTRFFAEVKEDGNQKGKGILAALYDSDVHDRFINLSKSLKKAADNYTLNIDATVAAHNESFIINKLQEYLAMKRGYGLFQRASKPREQACNRLLQVIKNKPCPVIKATINEQIGGIESMMRSWQSSEYLQILRGMLKNMDGHGDTNTGKSNSAGASGRKR